MSKQTTISREAAHRELARRSLLHYAKYTHPELSLTPFHSCYYQILERFARGKIRRLIISIPPQHGKSLGSSILLPSYLLGIRPELRIALASYNSKLASRFNRHIQKQMDNPLYRSIFPHSTLKSSGIPAKGAIRTAEEFELIDHDGGVISVGREGSLTGSRVDLVILDDLYKDAMEANSPLVRENTWEWYNTVVKTRLHNQAQELIVFTRWHEEDLIGRLEQRSELIPLESYAQLEGLLPHQWGHLNLEAIKVGAPTELDPRERGEALWPERHSFELLQEKRLLDPLTFEALYQGRPAPAEGLLYGERFQCYDTLPEGATLRANYTDTADGGEDYLCSLCYVVGADGLIYVTDLVFTQEPMEVSEPLVGEMLDRNHTVVARIESNNGGRGFARALKRQIKGRTRIEWFHQSRNKEARILSHASTVIERLRLPRKWRERWPEFASTLTSYKRIYRSNRYHDAADVITGVIEQEVESPNKRIRAIGFRSTT